MVVSLGVKKLKSVKSEFILGIQQVQLRDRLCVCVWWGEVRKARGMRTEFSSVCPLFLLFCVLPPTLKGFTCVSAGKESVCNVGDLGLIPGLGRSPGEGKGYPCQYSGLENSMDCIVHGVAKSWTRLSDFHFTFKGLEGYCACIVLKGKKLST